MEHQASALDVNQDGLSDVFQKKYNLTLGGNVTLRDSDNDGATDLQEFQFGTDPLVATSTPHVKPRMSPSGSYVLKQLVAGGSYQLETSQDLESWTTVQGPLTATGSSLSVSVAPQLVVLDKRYYRFSAAASQPDQDADGLNVIEEQLFGTSDLQADADGDGYNDSEEARLGLDPFVPNNSVPTVRFALLSEGTIYQGAQLSLQAIAVDPDPADTVSVSLFEGSQQLGSPVSNGPGNTFEFTVNAISAGPHIYLAKATDNHGASSWASIAVHAVQFSQQDHAYGPIEGGMKFVVQGSENDLRTNPFLRQPSFASVIGSVTEDTLYFDEQPDWAYGTYSQGHFLYVRSGSKRGAIFQLVGNTPNSLRLPTTTHGLMPGELIAVIPQWTLAEMLPQTSVHGATKVYVAENEYELPSSTYYRHIEGEGWVENAETTAQTVLLPPWGTFSIYHPVGSSQTTLNLLGDAIISPRRITLPAQSSADGLTLASVAFQPMSLSESGLKDAFLVRNATSDYVDVVDPGGDFLRWRLINQNWQPSSGASDGSTPVILPGGALILGRSDAFTADNTWFQPSGK
jgi:hypothetical protein